MKDGSARTDLKLFEGKPVGEAVNTKGLISYTRIKLKFMGRLKKRQEANRQ